MLAIKFCVAFTLVTFLIGASVVWKLHKQKRPHQKRQGQLPPEKTTQ